jgi:hypothetical protein
MLTEALRMKRRLEQTPDFLQTSFFGHLPPAMRDAMKQVGYNVPKAHQAWYEKALGAMGHGLTEAGKFIGEAIYERGIKPLGAPLEGGLHAYRTYKYLESQEAAKQGKLNKSFGRFTIAPWSFLDDWSDGWRATGDDRPDFSEPPEHILRTNDISLDERFIPIAVDAVGGMTPERLAAKYPDEAEEAIKDPNFHAALQALAGYQLSPGRQVMLGLGLRPGMRAPFQQEIETLAGAALGGLVGGPVGFAAGAAAGYKAGGKDLFEQYSGTADALVKFYGDPVNVGLGGVRVGGEVAGALGFAREYRRAALQTLDAADVVWNSTRGPFASRVQGAYADIANTFREAPETATGRLLDRYPGLDAFAEEFARVKPTTAAAVQDVFERKAGEIATLSGRASRYFSTEGLPTFGKADLAKRWAKEGVVNVFENIERVPGLRKVGTSFRRISHKIPTGDFVDATNSTKTLGRMRELLSYAHPTRDADRILGVWVAGDQAAKRQILTSAIDNIGVRFGSDTNPYVAEYMSKILGSS